MRRSGDLAAYGVSLCLALLSAEAWAGSQEVAKVVPADLPVQEGDVERAKALIEPAAPVVLPPPPPPRAVVNDPEMKPFGVEKAEPSRVDVFGYVKIGYFFTGPASEDALVGANSGFRLANLRVGAAFQPVNNVSIVASVDGSVARRNELDPLSGSRVVELRDAYVEWVKSPALKLRVGQFKAPYDIETLLGDGSLPFVSRSIVTDGVTPPDALPQEGLTLGRQLGIEAASERLGNGFLGLRYAFAITNGNGLNALNNDNNWVTPVARVQLELGSALALGVNGYYDIASLGLRPGRLTENRAGAGADLVWTHSGLSVMALFLYRNTVHRTTGLPSEQALGAVASVSYVHAQTGLEGGLRFAYLEPSRVQPLDQQMEAVAMVGYRAPFFPGRVILQYTLRMEEAPVSIGNNSVDAMLQVSF